VVLQLQSLNWQAGMFSLYEKKSIKKTALDKAHFDLNDIILGINILDFK